MGQARPEGTPFSNSRRDQTGRWEHSLSLPGTRPPPPSFPSVLITLFCLVRSPQPVLGFGVLFRLAFDHWPL